MTTSSTTTTPWIGSSVAAKRFGVDRATFNRWVAAGRIPVALQLEGKRGARLFDSATIDQLVAQHAESPITDEAPTE